jgi:mono/diheme cytochrome c family protein
MHRFIPGFLFLCVAVVGVAGFRGALSQKPPLEMFPDMVRQPKLRPQSRDSLFPDGLASRLPPAGTAARGLPYQTLSANTGRVPGGTNYVETLPVPVTTELLRRGQERFTVFCSPCHGAGGDGAGVVARLGMVTIANLHDCTIRKVVQMPDGQLFDTVANGKNLMNGYGASLAVSDRWAIVAYVRVLQRSRLATLADVPESLRSILTE